MGTTTQVRLDCDFCDEKSLVVIAPDGSVPPAVGWIVVSRDTDRQAEKYICCSTKCLLRTADKYASNPIAKSGLVLVDKPLPRDPV